MAPVQSATDGESPLDCFSAGLSAAAFVPDTGTEGGSRYENAAAARNLSCHYAKGGVR